MRSISQLHCDANLTLARQHKNNPPSSTSKLLICLHFTTRPWAIITPANMIKRPTKCNRLFYCLIVTRLFLVITHLSPILGSYYPLVYHLSFCGSLTYHTRNSISRQLNQIFKVARHLCEVIIATCCVSIYTASALSMLDGKSLSDFIR